jgi:hypothetical protein
MPADLTSANPSTYVNEPKEANKGDEYGKKLDEEKACKRHQRHASSSQNLAHHIISNISSHRNPTEKSR